MNGLPSQYPVSGTIQVSVIIPIYNAKNTLPRCLESLAAQTCKAIEFICVNDGSTDDSPAELEAWARRDARFRIIHQQNMGYGKAMNHGMHMAQGKYIGIVEPDDWVDSNMYEDLLALATRTSADIVKSSYFIEKKSGCKPISKFSRITGNEVFSPQDIPEYLKGAPSIWTALYQREWLEKENIRFSETPGASFQDLGFCIRTWICASKIAVTDTPYYHYWEDNPTSSSRRMEDGAWAAYKELELQSDLFENIPAQESKIRSYIVLRIFFTLRADYKLRIRNTSRSFLLKYSHILNDYFPLGTLDQSIFSKEEWFDLHLIYNTPLLFPKKSKTRANFIQNIFSCRTEAGIRVLRLLGMRIELGVSKKAKA